MVSTSSRWSRSSSSCCGAIRRRSSVFWSTVLTFALSFLTRETAIMPKKLVRALADGSISVLTAATTCATAGIIVGVVTLTGLGLKFSSIVIDYAGGSLLLTAIYTALIVWIVGLAVPVTASYIICAVIAAPAHDQARRARLSPRTCSSSIMRCCRRCRRRPRCRRSRPPRSPAAIPTRRRCRRGNTRCRPSWCRSCSCSIRRASACC